MKREVIQDFLNLPGIAGVALMDGRSRPYFCGVDQTLNFQQKEALAQGILRVVETIPAGFETFEFQFTGHQVHIYKLERGIILLVLTRTGLVYADYLQTIQNLKAVLNEDITNAIATFRLMAGSITLSGVNYQKPATAIGSSGISSPDNSTPTGNHLGQKPTSQPQVPSPSGQSAAPTSAPFSPNPSPIPTPSVASEPTLKDLLVTLNYFSKFTTQYLGTPVILNYWKSTRPAHDWLGNFQIDRSAQFTFNGAAPSADQAKLTLQEKVWVQEWVSAFIKRCSQVIRDFPNIVEQKALNETQKALLLGNRK
ncbi:hypothetical protein K9N68_27330 [Kovacikia minuta CCNUW1]|uniref:hypothetical protein n=1 Tax=Kovacikia minuta TaxID=2931930 RepID=UPI001CC995FE|nr:hypothetical protein [Kovacikia minuta]UBF25287.1 hypothetical protein K9N68_27330 [Kovacikia minuta CCNUW1]